MIGSDLYKPRVLCVALPDLSLKIVEHAFNKAGIIHHTIAGEELIPRIASQYVDMVIFSDAPEIEALIKNAEGVSSLTPVLDISNLPGHSQVLSEVDKILLKEVGPDWNYFEAAFPDDPQVVESLKIELKKELDYFENAFASAFEKKDKASLRDAIHRIEVVCEQLKLRAFLRSFYYLRKSSDFDEIQYLKDHLIGLIGSLNSRL